MVVVLVLNLVHNNTMPEVSPSNWTGSNRTSSSSDAGLCSLLHDGMGGMEGGGCYESRGFRGELPT